jgi:transposase-like protein
MSKHNKDFNEERAINQGEEVEFLSLEELARIGAMEMIRKALEKEINGFLSANEHLRIEDGRQAVVRNGYHKSRQIIIGSGSVDVCIPRTRNRLGGENYQSLIIPPYMRKSLQIEEAVPLLYLYGVSEMDMANALRGLLGDEAKGLSASSISRMKQGWSQEYHEWCKQDFTDKKYCYIWIDGIYFNVQGSEDRLCTLVMIGANENGEKEIIIVEDGYRESSEAWSGILRQLKEKGLNSPRLFIGDGSLGFWKAAKEIYPEARWQRCWVHKIRNILGSLPKVMKPKAKEILNEIYNAPDIENALKAFEAFKTVFGAKYPKAVECLQKDIELMLEFYSLPAEHWAHIRTTNVIESTFATVRLRTKKMRGCGSRETILVMVYKLLDKASSRWRKLRGYEKVKLVLEGVVFENGEQVKKAA